MKNKQKQIVGTLTITKDYFIEVIAQLEIQDRHDAKCIDAFKVILTADSYVMGYDNSWIRNQLIGMLERATDDTGIYSWIDYFIYELDYGRKYKKGCVTDKGKNIRLKTAGDLWDLLVSNFGKDDSKEDVTNSSETLESLESIFRD